jgi:hypothetical protein
VTLTAAAKRWGGCAGAGTGSDTDVKGAGVDAGVEAGVEEDEKSPRSLFPDAGVIAIAEGAFAGV